MSVLVRKATRFDTGAMAALLTEIVTIGGTTAITGPVSTEALSDWMRADAGAAAWHVAETPSGTLAGFQWIGPHSALPPEACDIATFVKTGKTQLGIGSRLFVATANAARTLGYDWINAEIRADNLGGLAYYQSRGFRVWGNREGVTLSDGQVVDKALMRFDLD